MKHHSKSGISLIVTVAMLVLSMAAAAPEPAKAAGKVRVKKVRITNVNKKKLVLQKGKTFQLKVKVRVTPNRKKYKKVKFVSSNKKVATVSSKGKIRAKKKGVAKISVISRKNKKKKETIKVTVTDRSVINKTPITPAPTTSAPAQTPASGAPDNASSQPAGTPVPDIPGSSTAEPSQTPASNTTLLRKPFSGTAYAGSTLSSVTLDGGSIADTDGNEIKGTYSWENPDEIMETPGRFSYDAQFVPEDPSLDTITGISVLVIVSKSRVILTAPEASSITTSQSLGSSELTGGSAKDTSGNTIKGSFRWTDESAVPGTPGTTPCSVTFFPEDSQEYQQTVCYTNVTVTGTSSAEVKEDTVVDISGRSWKNTEAYDRAWSGNAYDLSSYISGLNMNQYDKITFTIKLYDTSNNLITTTDNGSAVCKLSTAGSNWSGFTEVWTTEKAALSLEEYEGGSLFLIVQNTNANIGYIEITSMTLNIKLTSNIFDGSSLKNTYADIFGKVGTAIETYQINSNNIMNFTKSQYNSLTMGNEMKPDYILGGSPTLSDSNPAGYVDTAKFQYPYKDSKYPKIDMDAIDSYIQTAYDNGMKMRYHVFIWHAQSPQWFFKENYSTSSSSKYVSAEVMNGRLEYLIRNVMTHIYNLQDENGVYIGREVVDSWDIANEYFHNYNGGHKSYWDEVYYPDYTYKKNSHSGILTPYYIKEAFALAHSILKEYELQDSVGLFFNEFNTYDEAARIVTMINYFNTKDEINPEAETICNGIGMQTHLDCNYPTVGAVRKRSIEVFKKAGLEIQITEIDITDYTRSETTQSQQIQMWYDMLTMLMEEKESGAKISGITWWGPSDLTSWRSSGVPLLFSDYWQAKEHYFKVIQAASDHNTAAGQ